MDTPRKVEFGEKLKRFACSTKILNKSKGPRKPIKSLSNVELNDDHALDLPPGYKGSNMFMPTGERLYWLAEVLQPPLGPATCQDFHDIREKCRAEGVLFEDPEFPADDTSLCYSKDYLTKPIIWRRPKEIVENPKFCVNTYSRFDVRQGGVGDCGLLAVIADLPLRRDLLHRVVPNDQGFGKYYAGVFHFRFWQQGRWVDVVIDDRLPTDEEGQLFSVQASDSQCNEFWSALLEKAYAKLYGSYQSIDGGLELQAMEDFTGGLAETFNPSDLAADSSHKAVFGRLLKAYKSYSLLSAGSPEDIESKAPECGLVGGHAYSITCVKYVDDTPLVRLRNPWGFDEWTGKWSDKSPQWNFISQRMKRALNVTEDDNGEFWMTFKDFLNFFNNVTICSLNPGFLNENTESKKWKMSMFEGKWVAGETAGGMSSHSGSHWRNPQYLITVAEPDDDVEKCSVTISILQKHYRTRKGINYICVGFSVFSVDEEDQVPLNAAFLEDNEAVHEVLEYQGCITRLEVDPGSYVIVPCRNEPDEEGEFLLRVLTENPHHITKLN